MNARRIIEAGIAVVVVLALSCEVGCASTAPPASALRQPEFSLPPAPTVTWATPSVDTKATEAATKKLKDDLGDLWNAYLNAGTEAAKAAWRERLCPKP